VPSLASQPATPTSQSSARLVASIVALLAIHRYVTVFKDSLIDDAFIQLQYARTLATSGTWGFFAHRVTNTATSPLNVVLTALAGLIAPSMIDAVLWLTALEMLAILIFLLLASRKLFDGYAFGALAFVACVANPLVVSTMGLEGVLFIVWISASVYFFAAQRWSALAVALALLTLTRADGALLFAVFLLALPVNLEKKGRFVLLYALTLAPWYAYSWIHLGSLLPDTLKIKVFQRAFAAYGPYPYGPLLYLRAFPAATLFSVAMLPFGAFLFITANRPARTVAAIVGAFGMLHFVAYSAIRVPPYHWYYVNQVVACALVGSLGLASVIHERFARTRAGAASMLAGLAIPVAGIVAVTYPDSLHLAEMPIHSNWATHETYKAMGLWIRDHTDPASTILCLGEIGTLAFYSERYLINEFSDMNLITESIAGSSFRDKPLVGPLLGVNYYWRRMQPPLAPPRYRLQTARVVADMKSEPATQESLMSWDVSTRFIQWSLPGRRMRYTLTSSVAGVVK
jgi:hypothetical protein